MNSSAVPQTELNSAISVTFEFSSVFRKHGSLGFERMKCFYCFIMCALVFNTRLCRWGTWGGGSEAIGHAANNLGRNCDQYTIGHGIIIDIRLEALSFKIYAHYKGHEIYL